MQACSGTQNIKRRVPESGVTEIPEGTVEPPKLWRDGADAGPGELRSVRRERVKGQARLGSGDRWLSDERLRWIEVLLDEAFAVPGTRIRFGLDGIVGLIPGLGDILAAVFSLIIPLAAWVRGVPYITLIRMLANVSIGLLVGAIPILGDAFDVFWKANRRNYLLLTRSLAEPHRHTWRDWIFLLLLGVTITAVFTIPLIALVWLAEKLASWQPIH
jgi:hypothetical protein